MALNSTFHDCANSDALAGRESCGMENMAWIPSASSPQSAAAQAVAAWFSEGPSGGHYQTMMFPQAFQMSIAVAWTPNGWVVAALF
jgi:hypothetical protein